MIYLSGDGGKFKLVVLETANLDQLKRGHPVKTADESFVIAWTPDMVWLADKIADTKGDMQVIGKLIDEAAKRPEKPAPRPYHKPPVHTFEGPANPPPAELKAKPGVKARGEPGDGIFVRAEYPEGGFGRVLIEDLDKPSLLTWLRSRGGHNPMAENVVGLLLGAGQLCDPTEKRPETR